MTDLNYLQLASDLARAAAVDAGAPVPTGEMGRLHNTPAYAVKSLRNVIFEHHTSDEWACYDSRRQDPATGPVGSGPSFNHAFVNFLEQYDAGEHDGVKYTIVKEVPL